MSVEIDGHKLRGRMVRELLNGYRAGERLAGRRLQPGWEDRIWEILKVKYPGYIIENLPQEEPGVSIPAAWEFVNFLVKRMWDKSVVAAELAESRMQVCKSCPKRTEVLGCHICKDALKKHVKPPYEVQGPTGCKACLCYLPLKVWVPRSQLGSSKTFRYDPRCWMISEESPASAGSSASDAET